MSTMELIEQFHSGKNVREAQEQLYTMVREALLSRLETKIPRSLRARIGPEDVLHAAFIKAIEGLPGFHPKAENSFVAWVYTIAKNVILNTADRCSAAVVHFNREEDQRGVRESQVAGDATGATSQVRQHDWIEVTLKKLAPREAEVVRLHQVEGRSYEEIAASWKSTPGAVQRLYSRAWQNLNELAQREKK